MLQKGWTEDMAIEFAKLQMRNDEVVAICETIDILSRNRLSQHGPYMQNLDEVCRINLDILWNYTFHSQLGHSKAQICNYYSLIRTK